MTEFHYNPYKTIQKLYTSEPIVKKAKEGDVKNLDLCIRYLEFTKKFDTNKKIYYFELLCKVYLNNAARYGYLEVIDYIFNCLFNIQPEFIPKNIDCSKFIPLEFPLYVVKYSNKLRILELLYKETGMKYLTIKVFIYAVQYGKLPILKWLHCKMNEEISYDVCYNLIKKNHIECFKWARNIFPLTDKTIALLKKKGFDNYDDSNDFSDDDSSDCYSIDYDSDDSCVSGDIRPCDVKSVSSEMYVYEEWF